MQPAPRSPVTYRLVGMPAHQPSSTTSSCNTNAKSVRACYLRRRVSLTQVSLTIWTALLLAGCADPEKRMTRQPGSPSTFLQVGLVLDSPGADAVQFPAPSRQGRTNEFLTVRLVPGLDETNLGTNHQICALGLNLGVEVQFRDKAVQQLADLTRTNIGRHIAVISDGKVVSTPKIIREMAEGKLFLPGDWTFDEAMAFCKRLNPPAGSK